MPRIALISDHASPLAALGGVDAGGQNVYVAQLTRHLAALGFEIDVFTRRDDPAQPDVVELAPGARLFHVPAGPPARLPKEQLLPFMGDFSDCVLARAWDCGGYDLCHANFFLSTLPAMALKKAFGVPFVVTFHALGRVRLQHQGAADSFPRERLAIEERAVGEADAVIAECPQDRIDLRQLYFADPAKLRLIPCGFDPDEFAPQKKTEARARLGLGGDAFTVLQLGRMVPRKGVGNVIRGVARLRQRHGVAARLLVVGGESRDPDPRLTPEIGRLQAVAAEGGVADAVTFVGARGRAELRDWYAACDVFVTTPWYEPFGITPLEAMACGRPVVGSAVGGIRYTVRDGQSGFLVPPEDPDALADRLALLARRPELCRRLGRGALARVRSRFTWAHVAEAVARLYAEVLVGGPFAISGRAGVRGPRSRRGPRKQSTLS
jgi:D-inositol-3-phosphate glycosyltransferase